SLRFQKSTPMTPIINSYPALSNGTRNQISQRFGFGFCENVSSMCVYRMSADVQVCGNRITTLPLHDQSENFHFPFGEQRFRRQENNTGTHIVVRRLTVQSNK